MAALATDCLNHPLRPAVARCPSCQRSFCRECVVEHDFRIICASCLEKSAAAATQRSSERRLPVAPLLQMALALALLTFMFYLIASVLLRIPAEVHDGMIWTE